MLKTLDKYIIRKYLSTFFFTLLIFSLIVMVIDFSEKVDDFIEEKLSAITVLTQYYANNIPYLNGLLFPLYVLISVIFFTSRMAYNSEIISILNSGVSFNRLARPYIISAAFLMSLLLVANHLILPEGNKKLIAFENKYIFKHDQDSKQKNVHLFIDPENKIYFHTYNVYNNTGSEFALETIKDGKLISRLNANRAEWVDSTGQWRLYNYFSRTFLENREIIDKGALLDTTINLLPEDLQRRNNLRYTMTTPELQEFLKRERQRGMGKYNLYELEMHRRTSEPFSIIILTLIGMAIAARKVRGGIGFHLAMGAGIGGMFIILSKFATTFSTNANLPTLLGQWIPNIIFIFITWFIISRAQK